MSQSRRAYLYRVVAAALPTLAALGLLSDSQVPLWLGLAAAVLGVGTAAANTPTERGQQD